MKAMAKAKAAAPVKAMAKAKTRVASAAFLREQAKRAKKIAAEVVAAGSSDEPDEYGSEDDSQMISAAIAEAKKAKAAASVKTGEGSFSSESQPKLHQCQRGEVGAWGAEAWAAVTCRNHGTANR